MSRADIAIFHQYFWWYIIVVVGLFTSINLMMVTTSSLLIFLIHFVYRQNRSAYIRMMTKDLDTSYLRILTNRSVYIRMMTKDLYTSSIRILTKQICIHSYDDKRPLYIIYSYTDRQNRSVYIRMMTKDLYTSSIRIQTDKTDLYTFVWWQKTFIHHLFVYRQTKQICIHSYDDKRPLYIIYSYTDRQNRSVYIRMMTKDLYTSSIRIQTDKTDLYTFVWWQKTFIHHLFVYRQTKQICIHSYDDKRSVYIRMMTKDLYTSSIRIQTDKTDLYTFVWWQKTFIRHLFVYWQTKQICIHSYDDKRPLYIIRIWQKT